jgi:hypothetical protein
LDGPQTIFRNSGEIFTYIPHSEIPNLTIFFRGGDFGIEYDYHFRTNNFGLVEEADVATDQDSLLILGDSFTEGQGAEPWFAQVSPGIAKLGYQPINGGLLGTGFEQWNKLQRYLTEKKIRIRKVVVVFISDDYRRPVWQPTPATLQCLSSLALCRVQDSYYYRLPPPDELSLWVAKIRAARMPDRQKSWLASRSEAWLPASYHVYRYLKQKLYVGRREDPMEAARYEVAQEQSRRAIIELIGTYGRQSVAFLHIPQRDELATGATNIGLKARRSIGEAGGNFFDGFTLCGLAREDYYLKDGHPNSRGYAKIGACVTRVINQM